MNDFRVRIEYEIGDSSISTEAEAPTVAGAVEGAVRAMVETERTDEEVDDG